MGAALPQTIWQRQSAQSFPFQRAYEPTQLPMIDASSADAAVTAATYRAHIAASIEFGRQCYQP